VGADCTRKIKVGDIYYEIAKAYSTTVAWLRTKNPNVKEDNLRKNQASREPKIRPTCPSQPAGNF
jgi:hypothetical protein